MKYLLFVCISLEGKWNVADFIGDLFFIVWMYFPNLNTLIYCFSGWPNLCLFLVHANFKWSISQWWQQWDFNCWTYGMLLLWCQRSLRAAIWWDHSLKDNVHKVNFFICLCWKIIVLRPSIYYLRPIWLIIFPLPPLLNAAIPNHYYNFF